MKSFVYDYKMEILNGLRHKRLFLEHAMYCGLHYRFLRRIEKEDVKNFYHVECIQN